MIIGLHIYESEALLMENAEWGFISYGKFGSYKNEENFRKYHIYITLIAELIVD